MSVPKFLAWFVLMIFVCFVYSFLYGVVFSSVSSKPEDEFAGIGIFIMLYWLFPRLIVLTGIPIAVAMALNKSEPLRTKEWRSTRNLCLYYGIIAAIGLSVWVVIPVGLHK